MEEHLVTSVSGDFTRKVWLLPGAQTEPQTLCILLDAEYYLERMGADSLVSRLQTEDLFSAVTWIFVSNGGQAARHSDYICNASYSQYIAEDIVDWVRQRCDGLAERGHLICGLSLSGLASACIALRYPERFFGALCQSGSFWWNAEWLARNAITDSASQLKFWISVGDQELEKGISHAPSGMRQEISQLDATENMVRELKAIDAQVHYHQYSGGHAITPWQAELPTALSWLHQQST